MLGPGYEVRASLGHVADLPERELGVDVERDFAPTYEVKKDKKPVVEALKRAAKGKRLLIATDPDREGEAIGWHVARLLGRDPKEPLRVEFHEITPRVVRQAVQNPRPIDQNLVDAQQARRVLDRLVGYNLSPLLSLEFRKRALSAGRVQSVALRLLVEREEEIEAFRPEEYWTLEGVFALGQDRTLPASLYEVEGKRLWAGQGEKEGKLHLANEAQAKALAEEVKGRSYRVVQVETRERRKSPPPPFTTSTLQQAASSRLGYTASRTMRIAQRLYEGVDLPEGTVGLITYMRTDSVRVSPEALQAAREVIQRIFGLEYLPEGPRVYRNRKEGVQDAHEAIRPTVVTNTPDKLARYLNDDQLSLYRLIWQRFIASQMAQAEIDQNTVTIAAGDYFFGASGSTIRFPGFMALYLSFEESGAREQEQQKTMLPPLRNGQALHLHTLVPRQHFTQPPPRFSEASLVKELEENGIGRPSTYATILSTIREKGYVEMTKGYFHPTELGFIVNDLLVANFSDIFGVHFTARLEDNLDRIEAAQVDSLAVLKEFYAQFSQELERAGENMRSMRGIGIPVGLPCPACGKGELHIKVGKNGAYLACDRYPACRFTCNYQRDEKGRVQPIQPAAETVSDKLCEKCGRPMLVKEGRFGPFLACSGYPECQHTASLNGSGGGIPTGVACPVPGCGGMLMERRSKRGKVFYGCSRYPDCDYAIWDKPVPIPCPRCGHPFLVEKHTKKDGVFLACPNPGCGYRQDLDKNPAD